MPARQRTAAEMTTIRFRYEETREPAARIAMHHGMHPRTLYRMARREGWRLRPPAPRPQPPRPGRCRPDALPRDVEGLRRALAERLRLLDTK